MPTIQEYQKQRMLIRKSDPRRADVLGLILDTAKKAAKEENRETTEADFTAAVKKQIKAMEKTVELVQANNGDTSSQVAEIAIMREYLPPMMSEKELSAAIDRIMAEFPEEERIKKNQGKLMGRLKALGDSVDMGMAARILSGKLG
ncbi:GatB/YqeY domain-containing protein [Marispirochaeta aestuarii]|uniref:GatB/YqeY domain-containing protein n=1 Tax=Marispirochaeta aestuarii TaxID=1963862 RepID=UPI0029C7B22C|nr:GatB/YqeY domain-containing protein [Marispirochaeta aestuarii]